jgi:hypothetical protein
MEQPLEEATDLNQESTQNNSNMVSDIFSLPWMPFSSSIDLSEYRAMGQRGTVIKVVGLVLINLISVVALILFTVGDNPYIDLGDWGDPISPFLLFFSSFLVHTIAQFLCFRTVSGKGDLVAHAYLNALFSANYILLSIVAIIVLLIIRIRGIENVIIIIGGIYLLYVSLRAFQFLYGISIGRTIIGFILSIVVSILLFVLYSFPFAILSLVGKTELYDWRLMMLVSGIILLDVIILGYMIYQQKSVDEYLDGVPLLIPFKKMFRAKWVPLMLGTILVAFLAFYFLDHRYPSLYTDKPPYLISFLPSVDPDLMFISTRDDEFRAPTQLEIWQLSLNQRIDTIDIGMLVARLRPNEDGTALVLSNRQSPHGAASIFDPQTKQFSGGEFDYLKKYGILNPQRNEVYYTSGFGGVTVERENEKIKIKPEERFYSVAIHPNQDVLFFLSDNFIDIVDANSLEVVDTIKLGGKLRDLGVSPDGKSLYVTDALWGRIRVLPSPL